jgi:hypothetical protein
MKYIATIFLFAFSMFQAMGQLCTEPKPYAVNATSGLKMRAAPGIGNQVVKYIPKDSIVMVCDELGPAATFENIPGHWRMTTYKDVTGYLFDGFLTPQYSSTSLETDQRELVDEAPLVEDGKNEKASDVPAARDSAKASAPAAPTPTAPKTLTKYHLLTETYNYCGSIAEVDPGLIWYAVVKDGENSFLKRRELMVLKSKYTLSNNLEFDIRSDSEEDAGIFLIGFEKFIELDTTRPIVFHEANSFNLPKKYYPGMQSTLYGKIPGIHRENVVLYAIGNVKNVGICPEMQGYSLKIQGEKNEQLILQELNPLIRNMGICGLPELFWFGDLNADGYADLIFVTQREDSNQFILLTSDNPDSDKIYRRAAFWTIYNCE